MARCASLPAIVTTVPDRRPTISMRFEADLDILADGSAAHVRGDGSTLIVSSDHPAALVGTLRRALGPRRQLARIGDGLACNGVSVRVDGPRGPFATIGADADASPLRLLTTTRHVAPASVGAVVSLAGAAVVRHRWRWIIGIGSLVTALALWRGGRDRHGASGRTSGPTSSETRARGRRGRADFTRAIR